jgi:replicative DNA helicase
MSTATNAFKDAAAERTLIGTIIRHGKDAFLDAQAYVSPSDFSLPVNRAIFTCLSNLSEDPNCEKFDIDLIQLKAKALGLAGAFTGKKEQEYLDLLTDGNCSVGNIPAFGMQIKKYSVNRDLYQRYEDAQNYLASVKGDENLSDIIRNAESAILDYVSGKEDDSVLAGLCDDLMEEIQHKLDYEPVDQIGYPTGFNKYDKAIGGGLRKAAIAMVGARSKVGKGFFAMNAALNLAAQGIPVLYLDTEMTKKMQQARLISIYADCPLEKYETGKFKQSVDLRKKIIDCGRELSQFPLTYQEVAGMSHTEALALARRWIVKTVGFNGNGEANDCVIIYDYVKLTSANEITKNLAEHAALGFLMTDLSAFAIKYKVPILGFAQLNRDGINNDDGSVIASSDRILWLCSSMAFLRNKDNNDVDLGCGFEYGNKKLAILDTRYGAGLPFEDDYININASLRPRVNEDGATGRMTEGSLYSEVKGLC